MVVAVSSAMPIPVSSAAAAISLKSESISSAPRLEKPDVKSAKVFCNSSVDKPNSSAIFKYATA
jgi:hypothetical protein